MQATTDGPGRHELPQVVSRLNVRATGGTTSHQL